MFTLEKFSGGYYILKMQLDGFSYELALMDSDKPLEEVEKLERAADGLKITIPMSMDK